MPKVKKSTKSKQVSRRKAKKSPKSPKSKSKRVLKSSSVSKKRKLSSPSDYATISDYIAHEMEVWFRTIFIPRQESNLKKLSKISKHKINPYLAKYRSIALTGAVSPDGIARAMVIGTSLITGLNTSFGTQLQREITNILAGVNGSLTQGIDVEYKDFFDGKKKYAQIKAGPTTINKDDVKTIIGHFKQARSLGAVNNVSVSISDQVVGVIYGKKSDLNDHYKQIEREGYTVLVGDEFWEHMTGEKGLGTRLISVCAAAIPSTKLHTSLEKVISDLAKDPEIIALSK